MKMIIFILLIFLNANSCKKTESPCEIEERSKFISFEPKGFPNLSHSYDSFYIQRKKLGV